jgi:ribosome biogenesis protein NSA2
MHGLRAKLYHKKRHSEKIEMKKTYVDRLARAFSSFRIKMHEEKKSKNNEGDIVKDGAIPAYLLDRQEQSRSKVFECMFLAVPADLLDIE